MYASGPASNMTRALSYFLPVNFLDRLSFAFRFALSGKTAYDILPTWDQGKAAYPLANFEANVRSGYRKNELIFACISLKADSSAQPKLLAYGKDGSEKTDHALRALLKRPNPFMTEFDFFALTLAFLDLAGRAYWEKVRSRAGQVVQLWPLRPDWLRPVKQAGQFISGYQYSVPGISQPIPLAVNDVLDFKLHDPLDLYNGLAPASVAGRVGTVDNSATDFVKLFFESGGMPAGILTSKQKLIDAQVDDIRRRWRERYGGYAKWIDPAVLDSDATYQKLGLDFKEMGFEQLDARNEARVCMVLRTPPILIGATVGLARSTFSNYGEARRAYWEDTLAPQYKRIGDECQNDLASEFEDGLELRWDYSGVPAMQEDRDASWRRATAALSAGGLTVNMFLEEIGEEAIGPAGDVFLRTTLQVEVPMQTVRSVAKGALPTTKAAKPPDDDERRKHERALDTALNGYFDAQLGRVRRAAVKSGNNGHSGTTPVPRAVPKGAAMKPVEPAEPTRAVVPAAPSLPAVEAGTHVHVDIAKAEFPLPTPPAPDYSWLAEALKLDRAALADGLREMAGAVQKVADTPPTIIVNVEPTPVTVQNQVEPTPLTVNIEPTPVTIENNIENQIPAAAPAAVTVVPAPEGAEEITIKRDQHGRLESLRKRPLK